MEPWLSSARRRTPQQTALSTAERPLSYAQLYDLAARAGGELRARGVGAGDRVAVALPAGEAFAAAVHGVLLIGAVVVPIDLRLDAAARAARAAGAVSVQAPLSGTSPVEPVAVELDAPAAIIHTSGTTAAAKPVPLSHRNFLASALGSAVALGLDRDERWLGPMPLVHVGGLSVLIRSAIYGTTAVLQERFKTEMVLAALMDPAQRITLVSLVPTMLARLLSAGLRRPPTLRWALLGGGPIAPVLLEHALEAEVPVAPTYGMTEACSQIATRGWPLPGVEVRLAGGQPPAPGAPEEGEILVRGDTVARGALSSDGWLHTGDLGTIDERGALSITGRLADTIVSGGENVAPTEVEAALLEHPAVGDAGVFGREDAQWGEAVVAAVVLRDGRGATAAQLRAHCTSRLAGFKVPKAIEIVPALPRSGTGKLLREKLARSDV